MDTVDFPTTEDYTRADISRVQKVLYEMALIIARALEKHNVKYMISFGTLLGALRHRGFIPWDDDFDFLILEDDYEAAVASIIEDLPDWIAVQNQKNDPNYLPSWTTLVDKNSEAFSENDGGHTLLRYKGLGVDLFKATRAPESKVEVIRLKEAIDYYERKRLLPNAITEDFYRTRKEILGKSLAEAQMKEQSSPEGVEVYTFVTTYKRKFHYPEDIFPLRKYQFNDTEFWGPNNAEKILSELYGDWKSLPEFSKRSKHYRTVKFLN